MDAFDQVAAQQHRALEFMLEALGLPPVPEAAHRAVHLLIVEEQAEVLVRECQQLRHRVVELEHALRPDDAELEALARAADRRATREAKGSDEDI